MDKKTRQMLNEAPNLDNPVVAATAATLVGVGIGFALSTLLSSKEEEITRLRADADNLKPAGRKTRSLSPRQTTPPIHQGELSSRKKPCRFAVGLGRGASEATMPDYLELASEAEDFAAWTPDPNWLQATAGPCWLVLRPLSRPDFGTSRRRG